MLDAREQIERFHEFMEAEYKKELYRLKTEGLKSILIDFKKLAEFDPELSESLLEDPEEVIKAAEISFENFELKSKDLRIRFKDLPKTQEIKIRNIRSEHIDKFLYFEGIVRQSSDVRPQVISAKFECPSCGNAMTILQVDTQFKEPSRCSCGRRGRFRLLNKDLVDVQRLVVEESPELLEGGEQPKRLSVFIKEDMVEPKMERKTTPGSKIRVYGVIKEVAINLKGGGKSTRFDLMADANYITPIEETFEELEISGESMEKIKELSKDQNIYEKLTNSIAPAIYGHETIKEAILLQLMGGVKKEAKGGTKTRGDMHILLIGDPGSGKSKSLEFVTKIAPKGRLVSGKGVSGAGITASVVKDEFLRGWALEAGALVLSNGGFLFIDELDKIDPEDTAAMHQALEQQIITISKANIQACYSADTEVLTEVGWKNYKDVKNLKIAQYNQEEGTIEFLQHKGLFEYNYNGEMYHFKNKRNDILVTPDHKMLAKEYSQNKHSIIKAKDLTYNHIKFVNSGRFIGEGQEYFYLQPIQHKQKRVHPKYVHQHFPKKIPVNLWMEFLGYYLTEGGMQTNPTIAITQKIGHNADVIKSCLIGMSENVGFKLTEINMSPYKRFSITNTQLFNHIKDNCGGIDCNKRLPHDLSSLSNEQLKILYDSMMLGDGSSDGKYFCSTSKELIDSFQAIACLIGKSASMHITYEEESRGNRKRLYRISLSDKTEPSIRKRHIKRIGYNGKVFCFSTQTGFFITRRNGKIAIQGNTLKAETTVLGAANPKYGRFDPYQSIASQIDLPPTLINRFDLIFPIRDIPSREKDEKIATHLLGLHQKPEELKYEVPIDLLKKYIAYARQNVHPKLTNEAIDEIKRFYVELRNKPGTGSDEEVKPIPISARQLEALVRLSEASAKVRLENKVTKDDAKRAIKLLKHCLMQVGFDYETGQIDIDRISSGIPASQRSRIFAVRDIIKDLEGKVGKAIPIEEVVAAAEEKGISIDQVEEVIDRLKREGSVYEPKKGLISSI